MQRSPRLVLALLAPFVLAWSASTLAANCDNGRNKYRQQLAGQDISCSQSSCHGNNPAGDKNNILKGAAQPGNIDNALNNQSDMLGLRESLGLTTTDIDDIAEWIFFAPNCPAAAPAVGASTSSLAFGSVNVGASSSSQTITITNSGAANATGMNYPAAPAHYSKGGTCTNGPLAIGASCTVVFTFSPTAAGTFSPTYTITGGGGISIPISLSGTGVSASAPNIQVSPSSLDFGSVNVGQTSPVQTINVSNTGTAAATNMAYPAAPAKFTKGGTCGSATLNAGQNCTVTFTYTPTAAGPDNATYTISGTGGPFPVTLTGSGTAASPAALAAAPTSLVFGSVAVGSTSATQALVISNTGGSTATGVNLVNGNASEFPVTGSCATIVAGASCTVNVAYKPTSAASDSVNLTISYTGGTPVVVAMSGTGTAAPVANLSATPSTLAFGSLTVGATSGTQTVTIANGGGAQATGIAFANSNATEFAVSANTCGATLNAGASCSLQVAYTPGGAGADSASLTISYTGGANVVVAMSGTGTAAGAPNLQATPPLAAFGDVTVGQLSSATAITIGNAGTAAASGMAFVHSNATEFIVSGNTCGTTLNAGASCTLNVAYAPSAAGADSATLTVNFAGGGALSVSLSGTGVAAAPPPAGTGQLALPAALTMPDQTLGTTGAPQTVTVSNIGSAAVIVSSIASSNGGEFAVSGSTCATVNAGASCSFSVTFTPTAVGGRSATVTVTSNGAGSPQAIAVSGTGGGGATAPPPGTTAVAVEYYHAAFDHYFMTAIADEITKLDNGTFVGWARTGRSFNVYPNAGAGLNGVCRFFSTAFGAKSSHFYTPDAPECGVVKANVNWTFEAEVYYIPSPSFEGVCPVNTIPVYRVYNNGLGGAPNHRYTTDLGVRTAMLALGWIPEGAGPIGVIMCAPI